MYFYEVVEFVSESAGVGACHNIAHSLSEYTLEVRYSQPGVTGDVPVARWLDDQWVYPPLLAVIPVELKHRDGEASPFYLTPVLHRARVYFNVWGLYSKELIWRVESALPEFPDSEGGFIEGGRPPLPARLSEHAFAGEVVGFILQQSSFKVGDLILSRGADLVRSSESALNGALCDLWQGAIVQLCAAR
jgi:hypothetical protein